MIRTGQNGSILSFVVVGSILAVLMVGGVFFARQQANQKPQPAPFQTDGLSTASRNTDTPSVTQTNTKAEPSASGTTSSKAAELPHTGVDETIGTLVAIGLLCGSITAYVQSRRLIPTLT